MKAHNITSIIFLILCVSSVHLLSNESSKPCKLRSDLNNVTPPTPAARVSPPAAGVHNVRYVRVLSAQGPDSWLQISQMVVRNEKGVNVAKGKPASASSTWPGVSPATAVDGHEGARAHPHEFHANTPNNAWWMVDLQQDEIVTQMRYYNRVDCCKNRIVGARVLLLNKNMELLREYTINHDGPETIIHTVYNDGIPATPTRNVRFVRVLSATGPDSWLQISQLLVRNELGVNVAQGKPASASSTWPGVSPATAVDGHIGARAHPHEFHANTPNNAWWMVDLQSPQNIVQIRYYNRVDCCQRRIVGARVQLLDGNQQLLGEYTISHDGPETIIHTYQKTPFVAPPTPVAPLPSSRVWGVNSGDMIWTRDGVNGAWQRIDGGLKQITVGQDGRVWGVNNIDDIWTRDGVNGAWQRIEGKLKNIAVGADGRVWGVNSNDDIWTRPGVNGNWQQIDGKLKNISVGADGRVWGVNSNDDIWTRAGVNGTWQKIDGKLKNISVGADGRVWGANSNDDIWTRPGVNGNWQQIDGKLKQIHVTKSGRIWGVNKSDAIYTREGVNGTWKQLDGALKWVSAQ
jgi:hypothetical protein